MLTYSSCQQRCNDKTTPDLKQFSCVCEQCGTLKTNSIRYLLLNSSLKKQLIPCFISQSLSSLLCMFSFSNMIFFIQGPKWIELHGKTYERMLRVANVGRGSARFGVNITNSFLTCWSQDTCKLIGFSRKPVSGPRFWIMGSLATHQALLRETTLGKQCEKNTCEVGETSWPPKNFSRRQKWNMLAVWIPIWILIPQRQSKVFFTHISIHYRKKSSWIAKLDHFKRQMHTADMKVNPVIMAY